MTIHEFLAKWHDPESGAFLEALQVSLVPELHHYDPNNPLWGLRFRAEAEVEATSIEGCRELANSLPLQNRKADDVVAHLLSSLDVEMTAHVDRVRRYPQGNPTLGKPVIVVLVGAGFSRGFGLPLAKELLDYALIPCQDPEVRWGHWVEAMKESYPIADFVGADSPMKDKDVEFLLTVWEAYLGQLEEAGQRTGFEDDRFRAFVDNICCHLYGLGRRVPENHADRFQGLLSLS